MNSRALEIYFQPLSRHFQRAAQIKHMHLSSASDLIKAFRQLNVAKEKTTYYSGGKQKVIRESYLSMYKKVVQPIGQRKVKCTAKQTNSLAHTKWVCKYHIVFCPKYRRKIV